MKSAKRGFESSGGSDDERPEVLTEAEENILVKITLTNPFNRMISHIIPALNNVKSPHFFAIRIVIFVLSHSIFFSLSLGFFATEPMEVIPLSEPSTGLEAASSQALSSGSVQTESKPSVPKENVTAQQIMQLLQEIQNPQGALRSPPFLGENPCIPFFYRPDDQDEVKILVV